MRQLVLMTVVLYVVLSVLGMTAYPDTVIDMNRIKMMESSGFPRAINKVSGARGLYQITPVVLKEWNNYHPREQYTLDQLFCSKVNTTIAYWYMEYRIPQMLRYYKKADSVRNRLISYNAGIDYVVSGKKLPAETVEYIRRYNK